MLNQCTIQGRLAEEPELKYTKSNTPVCNFAVAVQRDYDREIADFIDCTAFGRLACFISDYFAVGKMILISGEMQTQNYEDARGIKRKKTFVLAEKAHFPDSKKD